MKTLPNYWRFALILCFAFALLGGVYFSFQTLSGPADLARVQADENPEVQSEMEDEMEDEMEGEEDGEAKMAAALERILQEFEMTKDPALDEVPRERLVAAKKFARKKLNNELQRTPIPGITWEERGPNNVGGRTRAILVDAADASGNTVVVGSVSGGIWRTTNFMSATPTWSAIDEFMGNLAVCSIVQDPGNSMVMYAGTGEGFGNIDAVRGLGIWKSTNGGLAWSQLASTNNFNFYYNNDLLFDTNGNLYAATGTGLFRSTDDGGSWVEVRTPSCKDLENGADGDVYVTYSSGSIYKSDFATHGANTGASANWTNITPPANDFSRIEIATAPSDANRIYAVCQGAFTNTADYLYRSTNGGTSWTSLTVPTICDQGAMPPPVFTRGQAWYDLIIAVDPNNPQTLFMGGVDAVRSTDGGNNWTQMTDWANNSGFFCAPGPQYPYVHADHHAFVYINGSSSQLIMGTDGGISHSTNANAASPTFTDKNTGYNVTQFYSCAMHPGNGSNYYLAGAQDNGTQKFTAAGLNNTTSFSGGDGGFCHIDQDNSMIQISAFTNNNYRVSINGGTSSSSANFAGGRFINPTDYDNDANMLYAASGATNYLRWNDPSTGGTSSDLVEAGFLGQASAVTCDPGVANRVWFGDGSGNVYRVNSAHTNSPSVTIYAWPTIGYVTSIDVDPTNGDRVLVTRSNYGVISVYILTPSTSTWTSIEGNLPDMPVRWGMFNPNNVDQALLATDLGVWSTDNIDGGTTDWDPTNASLANVRVDMLQYRAVDNTMAAGTHGRGLYTATIGASPFPTCSNLTTPTNGAMNVAVNTDLTWGAAGNGPTGYRLSIGTSPGGTEILNNSDLGLVTTYNPPTDFGAGATIYVRITPYNAAGDATGCTEESFMTAGAPVMTSCLPTYSNQCTSDDFIDEVILNTLSNIGTGCSNPGTNNYSDYTAMSTDLDAGMSYMIMVKPGPSWGEYFVGLIDYNQDGFFTADEFFDIGYAAAGSQISGTINVPLGATGGPTLMRVICRYNTPPLTFADICGTLSYGEVEDYTVNITVAVPPPSCTNLTTPTNGATNVAVNTDLTWAAAMGAPTGYKLTAGTTPGGTDIANNVDVGLVTTYNPMSDFPAASTIYVTITPYNAIGDATGCMEESFMTAGGGGILTNPSACQLGLPITDASCPTNDVFQIDVAAASGTVLGTDVILTDVNLIVEHTWVGDLEIKLVSPNGVEVPIAIDPCGNGNCDNFGDPTDMTCTMFTNFNMAGVDGPIATAGSGSAPFIGSYIPDGDFATFNDGSSPIGLWELRICDDAGGDAGELEFVELVFAKPPLTNPSACQLGLPITDASCPTNDVFQIDVAAASGTVLGTDVILTDVNLIVEHTWVGDLEIKLVSPNGVEVPIAIDPCNNGDCDNFGDPTDMTCTMFTNFNMAGVDGPIATAGSGSAPFIGSYIPDGDFATFNDGSSPIGLWELRICDDASSDVGELEYVELVFGPGAGCPTDLMVSGSPITPNSYYADNSITSVSTVGNPGLVEFFALNEILLNQGFEVELGAVFFATTGTGCPTPPALNNLPDDFYLVPPEKAASGQVEKK